jgi:hypothetical protein
MIKQAVQDSETPSSLSYLEQASAGHAEHASKLEAELHVGARAALEAARSQAYHSGDRPSTYLLDALRAAIAREAAEDTYLRMLSIRASTPQTTG